MLILFKLLHKINCYFNTVGLSAEGLYRVAGFFDDVEAIKMQFDKGEDASNYIHVTLV